jgi:hypothetical protein
VPLATCARFCGMSTPYPAWTEQHRKKSARSPLEQAVLAYRAGHLEALVMRATRLPSEAVGLTQRELSCEARLRSRAAQPRPGCALQSITAVRWPRALGLAGCKRAGLVS